LSYIVTGAAMGIGKAVALQLARDKANLILVDLAETELVETSSEARRLGAAVEKVLGSLADPQVADLAVTKAVRLWSTRRAFPQRRHSALRQRRDNRPGCLG
jgi:NAD(P)-dependent dehydrogenase (short-subunit alcohol dehydrogenase family)